MRYFIRKILSITFIVVVAGGLSLLAGCGNASGGSIGTDRVGYIAHSDGTVAFDSIPGKTPIGVVVEVNSNGYATKIVGLQEGVGDGNLGLSWSTITNTKTGATNLYDGLINQKTIERKPDFKEPDNKYPAFKYCADYGDAERGFDWYLPAEDELDLLWLKHDAIQEGLKKVSGASEIKVGGNFYWSSSEFAQGKVNAQRFSDGYKNNFSPDNTYFVRPFRAFP